MSRKVFISFLGTTNYVSCNYYYKDLQNKIDNVRSDIAFLTSDEKYFVGTTKYCDWKNDDIERIYDTLNTKNINT